MSTDEQKSRTFLVTFEEWTDDARDDMGRPEVDRFTRERTAPTAEQARAGAEAWAAGECCCQVVDVEEVEA